MTAADKYAVFGNPIKHSKSPQIHRMFAEQTQQQLNYRAVKVGADKFADAANSFFDNGGKGLNKEIRGIEVVGAAGVDRVDEGGICRSHGRRLEDL